VQYTVVAFCDKIKNNFHTVLCMFCRLWAVVVWKVLRRGHLISVYECFLRVSWKIFTLTTNGGQKLSCSQLKIASFPSKPPSPNDWRTADVTPAWFVGLLSQCTHFSPEPIGKWWHTSALLGCISQKHRWSTMVASSVELCW